jgi:SRSO17 transposase
VERKNGWQLAEDNGDAPLYGLQHLLGWVKWDTDAVRDALRAYLVQQMGDPQAVLVLEATGFLKEGPQSAGVARQDSGTAGRIEHSATAVGDETAVGAPDAHACLRHAGAGGLGDGR